jgi:hypothetical protein
MGKKPQKPQKPRTMYASHVLSSDKPLICKARPKVIQTCARAIGYGLGMVLKYSPAFLVNIMLGTPSEHGGGPVSPGIPRDKLARVPSAPFSPKNLSVPKLDKSGVPKEGIREVLEDLGVLDWWKGFRVGFHRDWTCRLFGHRFGFINKANIGMCDRCEEFYFTRNGVALGRVDVEQKYTRGVRRMMRRGMKGACDEKG